MSGLKDFEIQCLYTPEELQLQCLGMGISMNMEPCYMEKDESMEVDPVSQGEYEVEKILDCVHENGQVWFFVKWKDWEEEFNTWEPERNLINSRDLIKNYFERQKGLHKKCIENDSGNKVMKVFNRRHIKEFSKRVLKEEDVATMLKFCGMTYEEFVESGKTAKQLCKDLRSVVDCFLNKKKIGKKFMPVAFKVLISRNGFQSELLNFSKERLRVLKTLKQWESEINSLPGVRVPILVENNCDLEGPPRNFTYITDYCSSNGIVIPDDPFAGCNCTDCSKESKACCKVHGTDYYAYNKFGYVKVDEGTPIYECNKHCLCSDDCSNRIVQKGRTVELAIFRTNDGRGWGVKTLEKIKRGQFVMEYVGEVITTEEAESRGQIYEAEGHTYLFDLDFNALDHPFTVDAARLGNVAHFVNHSCDPNLNVFNVWINNLDLRLPRLAFFAKHDIRRGEELTFDYKMSVGPRESTPHRATTSPYRASSSKNLTDCPPSSPTYTPHDCGDSTDYCDVETEESQERVDAMWRIPCKCGAVKCRKYLY